MVDEIAQLLKEIVVDIAGGGLLSTGGVQAAVEGTGDGV